MTIKEFNELPHAIQRELLFTKGVKMSEHFSKELIAQRYALPGVQVCVIKKILNDEYVKIVAFTEIPVKPSVSEDLISMINYN